MIEHLYRTITSEHSDFEQSVQVADQPLETIKDVREVRKGTRPLFDKKPRRRKVVKVRCVGWQTSEVIFDVLHDSKGRTDRRYLYRLSIGQRITRVY